MDRLLFILTNINEQWWFIWKRNTSPTQKIVKGIFNWKYLVPILFSIGNIFCQCGILSVTAATGWSHLKRLIERHKMADRYIQSISRILLDIFLISEENQNSFATNGIRLQVIITANLFINEFFFEFSAIVAWLLPAIKRIGLLRADASQLAFKLGQLPPSWSYLGLLGLLLLPIVPILVILVYSGWLSASCGPIVLIRVRWSSACFYLVWEGSNCSL